MFREQVLINIAYSILSSFPAQALHNLSKIRSVLADANQLLADGYYMASVINFIKNA